MKTNEKVNEVLNDLIRINQDREAGYQKANKQLSINDSHLKEMFMRYAAESSQYVIVLSAEVVSNGGTPAQDTTLSGKIYRAWMEVKTAMSKDENKSVLESCEFGEDAAQKAYKQALDADVSMSSGLRDIITRQKLNLKTAHDEVKRHRDLIEAHQ